METKNTSKRPRATLLHGLFSIGSDVLFFSPSTDISRGLFQNTLMEKRIRQFPQLFLHSMAGVTKKRSRGREICFRGRSVGLDWLASVGRPR